MLSIDTDIDIEKLEHVLLMLCLTLAGTVGVSKLVDQHVRGPMLANGAETEFGDLDVEMFGDPARFCWLERSIASTPGRASRGRF